MPSPVTFEQVWAEEFAPLLAAARRERTEHLTEAFLDVTLTLCGEPIRQMTPVDLLQLDALGNPFVAGPADNTIHFVDVAGSADDTIHFVDVAGFLWQLSPHNTHEATLANLWRRARFLRRLRTLSLRPAAAQISAYVDRMLLDPSTPDTAAPPPATDPTSPFAPEPRTHFLAPLLVSVAAEMGPTDPMSGRLLSHTPLPRLLQYRREIQEKQNPEKTYTAADSLRNRCMDRVNQLNLAARVKVAEAPHAAP